MNVYRAKENFFLEWSFFFLEWSMFACQTNQRVGLDHMVYSVCQYVLGKKKIVFEKCFSKIIINCFVMKQLKTKTLRQKVEQEGGIFYYVFFFFFLSRKTKTYYMVVIKRAEGKIVGRGRKNNENTCLSLSLANKLWQFSYHVLS